MKIDLSKINIKQRVRKDLGDILSLEKSMDKFGLLQPIILNEKNELIAGYRRLKAAQNLKWKEIEFRVIPARTKKEMLEIEFAENHYRKDFLTEEAAIYNKKIEKLNHKSFFKIIWERVFLFLKNLFKKKRF